MGRVPGALLGWDGTAGVTQNGDSSDSYFTQKKGVPLPDGVGLPNLSGEGSALPRCALRGQSCLRARGNSPPPGTSNAEAPPDLTSWPPCQPYSYRTARLPRLSPASVSSRAQEPGSERETRRELVSTPPPRKWLGPALLNSRGFHSRGSRTLGRALGPVLSAGGRGPGNETFREET